MKDENQNWRGFGQDLSNQNGTQAAQAGKIAGEKGQKDRNGS